MPSGETRGGATVQQILAYAQAEANNPSANGWYRLCEAFANSAVGGPGGAPTAAAAFHSSPWKHAGDYNPPAGALVYWSGGAGHAAVSAGNGYVYSTDVRQRGRVSLVPITEVDHWLGGAHQYLGWTEGVNGVHIQGLAAPQPTTNFQGATGPAPTAPSATATPTDKLDINELEQMYGWNASFLKANPDLQNLVSQYASGAIATQSAFDAALRNTNWWRQNSDTWKKNQALKYSNPAEYGRQYQQVYDTVRATAGQMGGSFGSTLLHSIAQNAFDLGWDSNQIQMHLSSALNWNAHNNSGTGGQAGQIQDAIRKTAADYGVSVSGNFIGQRVAGILGNTETEQNYITEIRNMAKAAFPAWAKQIDAGQTMRDVAQPYVQAYGNLLEVDPSAITLQDHLLRKALNTTDPKTGTPGAMPVWQFENTLRADPRWQNTGNARDLYAGLTAQLGNEWGVM